MLFLFNLILLSLLLVMALAVASAASAPHSTNPGEVTSAGDALAATGVRAIPMQFNDGTSLSPKMSAVVAAGLQ